jgi:tetratricopeptide (TPR) repeat protein
MSYRTLLIVSSLLPLLFLAAAAQRPALRQMENQSISQSMQTLTGSVSSFDNQPVANARVELEQDGRPVADTYTNRAGDFEFDNLSSGSYHLRVTAGVNEISHDVEVFGPTAMGTMRLPKPADADIGTNTTVSVAQLKIPGKARDAFNKARKDAEKQKLDDARKHVDEALQIFPKFSDALALRGILKLDANDVAGATQDLESAVQDDQNDAMAYMALGSAYNLQGRYQDALRVLDHGVGLSPNSWQAYFEMGKSYLGQSDYQAALRQLNKAEDLAPKEYAPVHLVKAHALLGLRNYDEAVSELEAYLQRDPKGPQSDQAREVLDKARAFAAAKK